MIGRCSNCNKLAEVTPSGFCSEECERKYDDFISWIAVGNREEVHTVIEEELRKECPQQ